MAELSSKFTQEDIEKLIESVGDWEVNGSQEYLFMTRILDAPALPEDHEAFEIWTQIRDHYRSRKQILEDRHADRQEQAVFLKAKLMLVRKEMRVNDVFEMAAEEVKAVPKKKKVVPDSPASPRTAQSTQKIPVSVSDAQKKLEDAEFFIKDLGVWEHYQKFLAEKSDSQPK